MYSYIHIPFCESKCKYCRFASLWAVQDKLVKIYIAHLLSEIKNYNSGKINPHSEYKKYFPQQTALPKSEILELINNNVNDLKIEEEIKID